MNWIEINWFNGWINYWIAGIAGLVSIKLHLVSNSIFSLNSVIQSSLLPKFSFIPSSQLGGWFKFKLQFAFSFNFLSLIYEITNWTNSESYSRKIDSANEWRISQFAGIILASNQPHSINQSQKSTNQINQFSIKIEIGLIDWWFQIDIELRIGLFSEIINYCSLSLNWFHQSNRKANQQQKTSTRSKPRQKTSLKSKFACSSISSLRNLLNWNWSLMKENWSWSQKAN